jgi:hypothetical protein
MDPVDVYRYARRTLRSVGAQHMTAADWDAFHHEVTAMLAALDSGDHARVAAGAGRLALLSDDRQDAAVDPHRREQPPLTRTAGGNLSRRLDELITLYQKEAAERRGGTTPRAGDR